VLRLAADENFDNHILAGLVRRQSSIDIVRVQDAGLANADDVAILAWAAEQGRVVLTHDAATMIGFAYDRVQAGLPMPGMIEVRMGLPVGRTVEELLLVVAASLPGELDGQVVYVPL
jgi:predicted nuclease of predicted toxin-antitoxin system